MNTISISAHKVILKLDNDEIPFKSEDDLFGYLNTKIVRIKSSGLKYRIDKVLGRVMTVIFHPDGDVEVANCKVQNGVLINDQRLTRPFPEYAIITAPRKLKTGIPVFFVDHIGVSTFDPYNYSPNIYSIDKLKKMLFEARDISPVEMSKALEDKLKVDYIMTPELFGALNHNWYYDKVSKKKLPFRTLMIVGGGIFLIGLLAGIIVGARYIVQ